ncbi:hypothetical protein [Gallaecimonas sp. GXIMD4217]|uniref:hypothetical protein n=1 Tax=Gallaecimonas sp. GXIMD4217 TaxID=3131927 RepID=UPI00311AC38D
MVNMDPFIPFLPRPSAVPDKPRRQVEQVQKTPPSAKAEAHMEDLDRSRLGVLEREQRRERRRRQFRPRRRKAGNIQHFYNRLGVEREEIDRDGDLDTFA